MNQRCQEAEQAIVGCVQHCLLDLFADDANPYTEEDVAYAAHVILNTLGLEVVDVIGTEISARINL